MTAAGEETETTTTTRQDVKWNSISLGSCFFGINIGLHWSMLLILILSLIAALYENSLTIALRYLLVYGPCLFASCLVHDLFQIIITRRNGGDVEKIVIWPLGGLTVIGSDTNIFHDLQAAIAGPIGYLFNMALMSIVYAIIKKGDMSLIFRTIEFETFKANIESSAAEFVASIARTGIRGNLNLFILSLLPVHPFDGGRILGNSVMLLGRMSVSKAAGTVAVFGVCLGLSFTVIALVLVFRDNYNDGLDFWLLLIGGFLSFTSLNIFDRVKNGTLKFDLIFGRPLYDQTEAPSETEMSESGNGENENGSPQRPSLSTIPIESVDENEIL